MEAEASASHRLRILQVIGSVAPRYGGPTVAVLHMSAALARRGHQVHLLTTNIDGAGELDVPLGSPMEQDGYTITYCPVQWPRRFLTSWPMLTALRGLIKNTDVLDVHSLYLFHTLAASRLARRCHIPYVVRPHGTLDRYQRQQHVWRKWLYWNAIERKNLNAADAMHYTSKKERLEAEEAGVTAPAYVIPLGVELSEFEGAARIKYRDDQVLFLGRLAQKKGVDVLLRAWAHVTAVIPTARLVVAGPDDSGLRPQLERLAHDLGVERAVRFLGPVYGQQKMALLGSSALLALPSKDENFGITVVEAMASGMPVVITEGVALHDEIVAAGAGVVVRRDPHDVAAGILQYLRDPGARDLAASMALDLVTRRYTWDACAMGLEAMYEAMLSGKANEH